MHGGDTDWAAYYRIQWQREDTLDPVARLATRIDVRALLAWVHDRRAAA